MKVFISWSGPLSHKVASALKLWIRSVLQATRPFLSSSDIDNGAVWFNKIAEELQATDVGIICLTHANKEAPWILFEAGALAKGLSTSRVCTLLIDLEPTDVLNPLAQFNHTALKKEALLGLVAMLNARLGEHALDDATLQRSFENSWGQFDTELKGILEAAPNGKVAKSRDTKELLAEILVNTRNIGRRLRELDIRRPNLAWVDDRRPRHFVSTPSGVNEFIQPLPFDNDESDNFNKAMRSTKASASRLDAVLDLIAEQARVQSENFRSTGQPTRPPEKPEDTEES